MTQQAACQAVLHDRLIRNYYQRPKELFMRNLATGGICRAIVTLGHHLHPKIIRIFTVKEPFMEIVVDFPGGARVDAHFDGFTIQTDQPAPGGTASAPTPFATFLASIGTCAGFYVLGFCRQRNIPTDGMKIIQRVERDPATHMVSLVALDIHLPPGFPEKYKSAVIRSADQCTVKKHLAQPPAFEIRTIMADEARE